MQRGITKSLNYGSLTSQKKYFIYDNVVHVNSLNRKFFFKIWIIFFIKVFPAVVKSTSFLQADSKNILKCYTRFRILSFLKVACFFNS